MPKRKRDRGAHRPDERAENREERREASSADEEALMRRIRGLEDERGVMSSAMGGTSDAGTAADDAAESAALDIGLPDDRTRQAEPDATAEDHTRGRREHRNPPRAPEV